MILRAAYLVLATATLTGCAVGEQVARDQAKSVVTPIVAQKFPGLPTEPVTNCVIDNATFQEIVTLAAATGTGSNAKAVKVVMDVASRPATIKCVAKQGLPALLSGLG
jgi:predicted ThiF/HesA family dinucleotide-utilizing enzyme